MVQPRRKSPWLALARKGANVWIRFWMLLAGFGPVGRTATWLATWFAPPHYARFYLARLYRHGFISPSAKLSHDDIHLGQNVFIGNRVIVFQDYHGGQVEIGARVRLMDDTNIQTGVGGSVRIGDDTLVERGCLIEAYRASIDVGSDVLIGARCAFYPFDHGFAPDKPINQQPLQTKGGIIIGDHSWLGYGVIVLSGVRIGTGAVIGAGSVVINDVPDGAIAVGAPARVVRMRGEESLGKPVHSV